MACATIQRNDQYTARFNTRSIIQGLLSVFDCLDDDLVSSCSNFFSIRLFHQSQLIVHTVIPLVMISVHLGNKMMNKCLCKKSYPKQINCMCDWHQMVIVYASSSRLMVQQSPHFAYTNVRNPLEWVQCHDVSFFPVITMGLFRCGT